MDARGWQRKGSAMSIALSESLLDKRTWLSKFLTSLVIGWDPVRTANWGRGRFEFCKHMRGGLSTWDEKTASRGVAGLSGFRRSPSSRHVCIIRAKWYEKKRIIRHNRKRRVSTFVQAANHIRWTHRPSGKSGDGCLHFRVGFKAAPVVDTPVLHTKNMKNERQGKPREGRI